ncbi:MAG TPA: methyltransferase domain-containing protein [Baekduia sp.]|nr:methyltransferase domain-containing protein [Baekduia sp.]
MSDATGGDREAKVRARAMWAAGDFPTVARTVTPVGPHIVAACGVGPGQRVLDVAAGAGNTAIPAAVAGADVVASDLTPEMFDAGRADAARAGVEVTWIEADCEQLPFDDASFDVVTSSFGAMFAPDHQRTAGELLRVCRPGGTIGMANWTPQGWVGQFFLTMLPFMPPPPEGASPPPLWGVEDHVRELFGDAVSELTLTREVVELDQFATPGELVDFYRSYFGPTIVAYRTVEAEPERRAALDTALLDFARRSNLAADGEHARWEMEYLLVVARRAG